MSTVWVLEKYETVLDAAGTTLGRAVSTHIFSDKPPLHRIFDIVGKDVGAAMVLDFGKYYLASREDRPSYMMYPQKVEQVSGQDAYDIKLHWDHCAWVARFTTSGGPDVCSQGASPDEALKRLGGQLAAEIWEAGGIHKIPKLQASAV